MAVQSPIAGIGELLSLWGETTAGKDQPGAGQIKSEQLLVRLQQARIPERLEKVSDDEKAYV